ncbi:hypothetical protein MSG28_005972 [Choristoneura fumiferana]|uniref:Uncharacterized protein n=1 Tax=Choristoneura fumiferana TaxID=7141 RepID=A0ACC0L125_CHOFU|nr:hypothetical protein MSG28_005972 [Choristoneura fumiferana]
MEDFDLFSDEINFTRPDYKDVLSKYVNEIPATPSGPNYQSGNKLMAEEYLAQEDDARCAFHLSEAVSKEDEKILDLLSVDTKNITEVLSSFDMEEDVPFHKKYLKFSSQNNVDNFKKILNELPKEWTVIQLTAQYNPNENLKPFVEYSTEISSIYLSMFTNDFIDQCDCGPITVNIPANVPGGIFIRLTTKQRVLLYNLIESSPSLSSQQIKPCIRRILTEHGRTSDIKQNLVPCTSCSKDFRIPSELCLKCLMKCFEAVHKFTVVDGIRAFSQAVMKVREDDEFAGLRKAKRQPVVLIVDEKRMSSFIKYWCGSWSGHVARPPPPHEFVQHLTHSDIFLYCGHGDGCQLGNGGCAERAVGSRCVALLAGCGSVRLTHAAARGATQAAQHRLRLAARSDHDQLVL